MNNMELTILYTFVNGFFQAFFHSSLVWKSSNIAEAFGPDGRTKMSARIHEIFPSEVTCTMETDDVLYFLVGELEIEVNGEK